MPHPLGVVDSEANLTITPVTTVGNGEVDLPGGFTAIPVGETSSAKMKLNFEDPDIRNLTWTLRFQSNLWPESTNLLVTRTDTDTWVVQGDTGSDQATLIRDNSDPEGTYRIPFELTVVR